MFWESSSSNIKKILKTSQEKTILIFQETETPEKLLTFSQEKLFPIFW